MLQRKCSECADEEHPQAEAGGEAQAVPAVVGDVLRSGGKPLDQGLRAYFEPRFGQELTDVRVHTGAQADASASAVDATAYTVGRDIVFREGAFAPETGEGRRLLAHELTHVVQQTGRADRGASGAVAASRIGAPHDATEAEADRVADAVVSGSTAAVPARQGAGTVQRQPADPAKCKADCDAQFKECTKGSFEGSGCLGSLNYCYNRCDAGKAPPAKPEAPAKPAAPVEKAEPKVCDPPKGPGKQPDMVSRTMLDRWMGKYAKQGDQGEGCIPYPYVASVGEKVCTVLYGHQIKDCPVLLKATGKEPTAAERKTAKVSDMTCACEGQRKYDCQGSEGEEQLKTDARGKIAAIRRDLPVDLSQAELDALVDLSLHHGSVPPSLVAEIKKYWCTPEGKDHVRDLYLQSNLQREGSSKVDPAFVARRKARVWPPSR
jgi:hypothetical protein